MYHQKNKSYLKLIIWIASLVLVGTIIGTLIKPNVDFWYVELNRSLLTPPNYVFSITWTILYTMIALSGWLIWNARPFSELQKIKNLYIAQLILNWSWTPLFFNYHLVGLAFTCLISLTTLVAILVVKAYKNIPNASFLLIPYFLWLLYASYLNFYIWQYN